MTDTLIADADGVYHPALFNDRLLLGHEGDHVRGRDCTSCGPASTAGSAPRPPAANCAAALPVGLVWGEADGRDPATPRRGRHAASSPRSSSRSPPAGRRAAVWLWLREQGLKFPLQPTGYLRGEPRSSGSSPTYHAVHNVLTHPAYAGAYVFGKTRQHRYVGADGAPRIRRRKLPQIEWEVLITDHHPGSSTGTPTRPTRPGSRANTRPVAHQPGTGAVREGCALLQGLASCGVCGRKLAVYYDGPHKATPGYYCTGTGQLVDGRGTRHLRVGGVAIDAAVGQAFLAALAPAALQACLAAAQQLEDGHDTALAQWRRQVRTRPLRRGQGRTPLPGRRPGQPARRPRAGNRLGTSAAPTWPTPKPNSPAAKPPARKP